MHLTFIVSSPLDKDLNSRGSYYFINNVKRFVIKSLVLRQRGQKALNINKHLT
jgi:hypothetical protein